MGCDQSEGEDRSAAAQGLWAAFWLGLTLAFAVMVKASLALLGAFIAGFLLIRLRKSNKTTMASRVPPPNLFGGEAGPPQAQHESGTRRNCSRQRTFYALSVIALAFFLGMAPWWVRNHSVFGEFVPWSTMGGFTLYESFSEQADGGPNNDKIVFPKTWLFYLRVLNHEAEALRLTKIDAGEAERLADQELKDQASAWMRANPGRCAALVMRKLERTWTPLPNWLGAQAWHYKLASAGTYIPVIALMLYAVWAYRHRWRDVYLLLVPALYIACLHSIFMGSIRYRLPAMPCLMILAAAGLVRRPHARRTSA